MGTPYWWMVNIQPLAGAVEGFPGRVRPSPWFSLIGITSYFILENLSTLFLIGSEKAC
jgi:hypothetical protein